jgi:hypothetical protein
MTKTIKPAFKRPPGLQQFIQQPLQEIANATEENKQAIEQSFGKSSEKANQNKIDINTNTGIDSVLPIISKSKISKASFDESSNPRSIKRKVFNVRLNAYYLEALRSFSKPEEGVSMQKVAREIIEKGLDEMILNSRR